MKTLSAKQIAEKIGLKFRKDWNKNNRIFSDGKSIEIWIKQTIENELKDQLTAHYEDGKEDAIDDIKKKVR